MVFTLTFVLGVYVRFEFWAFRWMYVLIDVFICGLLLMLRWV